MAPPLSPAPRLNRSQNRYNFDSAMESFNRRDYVIKKIGRDNLEAFEMWAFPPHAGTMIYDGNIHFHWANAHSTKSVPINPDDALDAIVNIWIRQFGESVAESSGEYEFERNS
jgi:hypothetical protein